MNDLDDLKRAMQSPPGYAPGELDLGEIMRSGGRLRLRRRLVTGAPAAAAVVVLLVGGSQLIGPRTNPGRGTPIAPAAAAPVSTPATPPTVVGSEPTQKPWGTLIRTGLVTPYGEWVFYAVAIKEAAIPDTHFGITLGQLRGDQLDASILINESHGSDRAPGFHSGETPTNIGGRTTPAFGYYVGKPYRITAVLHNKTVTATQRAWSIDPSVVVFWFDPAEVGLGASLTHLTAYDRLGKKLASGNPSLGAG